MLKRLLFLLLWASPVFAAADTITSSVCFQDPTGTCLANGLIIFDLSAPAKVIAGGQVAPVRASVTFDANGKIPANVLLYGNDQLQPTGTFYTVRIFNSNGLLVSGPLIWVISGASPVDLSLITASSGPTDPGLANPVLQNPSGNQTVTQPAGTSLNFIGTTTAQTFNSIRYADNYAGADCGAKINAASTAGGVNTLIIVGSSTTCPSPITTALSLAVNTVIQFGPGVWRWNTYNTFPQALIAVRGSGAAVTEFDLGVATGDWATVTGATFRLSGIFFAPATGITRTSGGILNIQASGGKVDDVLLSDPWNGFYSTTAASNQWTFQNIYIQTAGGNWNSLFQIGPIASGTITGWIVHGILGTVANATVSAPLILLDSGTDGPSFWGNNFGTSQSTTNTFPIIKLQSTGAAQVPSWARFANTFVEAGTNASLPAAIVIANGRDFSYANGYEATSTNGVQITGGTGIRFVSNVFVNNRQNAFSITGGSDILIDDNDISDNGQQTTNTYDAISIAANVNDFRITNNRIGNQLLGSGTLSRNGVNIATGTSDNYAVLGNFFANLGTSFVVDNGTGTHKMILNMSDGSSTIGQVVTFAKGALLSGATPLQIAGASSGTLSILAQPTASGTLNLPNAGAGFGDSVYGTYRVTADQTITAGASLTNIPGLTWMMPANTALNVAFHCEGSYNETTAATSMQFGIQDVTVAPTNIYTKKIVWTSTSAAAADNTPTLTTTTATGIGAAFTPSAATTVFNFTLDGMIEQPSNASSSAINIMAQFTTNNGTIKRGSYCRVW